MEGKKYSKFNKDMKNYLYCLVIILVVISFLDINPNTKNWLTDISLRVIVWLITGWVITYVSERIVDRVFNQKSRMKLEKAFLIIKIRGLRFSISLYALSVFLVEKFLFN